jgi:hypothetical protein
MIRLVLLALGVLVVLPVVPMLRRASGLMATIARSIAGFGLAFCVFVCWLPGDVMTRIGLGLYAAMIEALCVAAAAVLAAFAEARRT